MAAVVGIDPQKEEAMTGLKERLVSGAFLTNSDTGMLLAEGLARRMKIGIGDSLILYGSGYHGHIAAAALTVHGIVKLPLPQMNNQLAFLELKNAQFIYAAPGLITSLSIMIDNIAHLAQTDTAVHTLINKKSTVMTWDEMMPELVQSIQVDNAGGLIMVGILYMVIAFGIFGTIMMMTAEREKEFGILNGIGMKKNKLIFVSILESFMVSFIGVIAGVLSSIPITYYYKSNPIVLSGDSAKAWVSLGIEPIMTFSVDPTIYLSQSIIVFIIALICAFYPLFFISKLNVVSAMRK